MMVKCGVGVMKLVNLCTAPNCYVCLTLPELSPIIYKVNINQ